eukprot:gene48967-59948_t
MAATAMAESSRPTASLAAMLAERGSRRFRSPPRGGAVGRDRGWRLAVASTSARESVEAMLRHAVGETTAERFSFVLAADSVAQKKPAPEIYEHAAARFGVSPTQCVVIEDSHIDATRMADGTAYSGGNGVRYVGLVGADTAASLGGTLAYGGSSQGASSAGTYAITPGGLL